MLLCGRAHSLKSMAGRSWQQDRRTLELVSGQSIKQMILHDVNGVIRFGRIIGQGTPGHRVVIHATRPPTCHDSDLESVNAVRPLLRKVHRPTFTLTLLNSMKLCDNLGKSAWCRPLGSGNTWYKRVIFLNAHSCAEQTKMSAP
eukprot:m.18488 g.18488  ORF g.18488 m.18488 type:complete len:144 (+) comp5320_c0_seq1:1124-1555(+)